MKGYNINLNKGFYCTFETQDIFGLGVAIGYIPENRDLQCTMLLGNVSVAVGYLF